MSTSASGDVELLRNHVELKITDFHTFGIGWPGNVELSLIDTVLSIRARYGVTEDTGVRGAIKRYKEASGRERWDDLPTLSGADPEWLTGVLRNKQKTGGVPKVEAILGAARRLAGVGAVHAADIDRNSSAQRDAYCGTKGLGRVTWAYFLMLVGHDGVKADTLVTRFVSEALGRTPDGPSVVRLVTAVAEGRAMKAADLDHSIWRYMSNPRRS